MSLAVLYATETGVSKSIAETITKLLATKELSSYLKSCDEVPVESLKDFRLVIIVCSSTGQGDPPETAAKFYRQLRRLATDHSQPLSNLRYTLLGLGDSNYQTFGAFPKSLHKVLSSLGATTFYDFALADDAVGLDIVVEPWLENLLSAVGNELHSNIIPEMSTKSASSLNTIDNTILIGKNLNRPENGWKLPSLPPSTFKISFDDKNATNADFFRQYHESQTYFGASSAVAMLPVKGAGVITKPAALKPVYEMVIDCMQLSSFEALRPGDSFSILCSNDEVEVSKLIERLDSSKHADCQLKIEGKLPSHLPVNGIHCTLRNLLLHCVDIRSAPKKTFLRLMASCCTSPEERLELEYLSSFEGANDFSTFIREAQLSMLDLLLNFPSMKLGLAEFIENLPPLKPRSYSIANYPSGARELRFAFSEVFLPKEDSKRTSDRYGVCTKYLLDVLSAFERGEKVHLTMFTRTTQAFRLLENMSNPLILISAGTGIAPYVGFLEYIEAQKHKNLAIPSEIWLLHGCRNQDADLLYSQKINDWTKRGIISKLVLACSRQDSPQPDGSRTYVQHRLIELGESLMSLDPPATIYACGDAAKMAPSLREALVSIISRHNNVTKEDALVVFKSWTKNGRYKEDVWR